MIDKRSSLRGPAAVLTTGEAELADDRPRAATQEATEPGAAAVERSPSLTATRSCRTQTSLPASVASSGHAGSRDLVAGMWHRQSTSQRVTSLAVAHRRLCHRPPRKSSSARPGVAPLGAQRGRRGPCDSSCCRGGAAGKELAVSEATVKVAAAPRADTGSRSPLSRPMATAPPTSAADCYTADY